MEIAKLDREKKKTQSFFLSLYFRRSDWFGRRKYSLVSTLASFFLLPESCCFHEWTRFPCPLLFISNSASFITLFWLLSYIFYELQLCRPSTWVYTYLLSFCSFLESGGQVLGVFCVHWIMPSTGLGIKPALKPLRINWLISPKQIQAFALISFPYQFFGGDHR